METKKEVKREGYAVRIALVESGAEVARGALHLIYNDLHKEPYGFIEDIFVDENHRRQGLGNQILDLLLAEAKERGCYKVIGTARDAKPDVQAWYERKGLKRWGAEFRIDL